MIPSCRSGRLQLSGIAKYRSLPSKILTVALGLFGLHPPSSFLAQAPNRSGDSEKSHSNTTFSVNIEDRERRRQHLWTRTGSKKDRGPREYQSVILNRPRGKDIYGTHGVYPPPRSQTFEPRRSSVFGLPFAKTTHLIYILMHSRSLAYTSALACHFFIYLSRSLRARLPLTFSLFLSSLTWSLC